MPEYPTKHQAQYVSLSLLYFLLFPFIFCNFPLISRSHPPLPQQRLAQQAYDFNPQSFRRDDLNLRPVFQDVHDKLAVVRIRDLKNVVRAVKPALLLRMPRFIGHPATAFWCKAQHSGVLGLAREDAKSGGEMRIEFGFGDFLGGFVENLYLSEAVYGKAPERSLTVVPRIQVPVFPVVRQTMGGNHSLGRLVVSAAMINDVQAFAAENSVRHNREVCGISAAGSHAQNANAVGEGALGIVPGLEYSLDAFTQRRQMAFEQAGLELGQEALNG